MKKTLSLIAASCLIILASAQTEPAPKPPLEDFVGKYVFPEGSPVPDVIVTISGSALHMSSAAGASILNELGVDSFQIIEFNGIAVFKRGDDKKVNGVHIEAQGYVLDGKKESIGGSWVFTFYSKPDSELSLAKR